MNLIVVKIPHEVVCLDSNRHPNIKTEDDFNDTWSSIIHVRRYKKESFLELESESFCVFKCDLIYCPKVYLRRFKI